MASINRVTRLAKFLSLIVILLAVTTSCGRPHKKVEEPAQTPATQNEAASANPLAHPVNYPFPGPYKTILVDGEEYKQGRFPQGTYGGTLVQSIIASDPKTFNYWSSDDATSSRLAGYMWQGLLNTDPYTGDVIPELAEEFKMMPDHVTYITKLRKGLKWSDGKPITADDVAFTFNTIVARGLGNASARDVMSVEGKMPEVTVVDELTNKFVTAKPFAPFLRTLSEPIAPKHIIEPMLTGKDAPKKFQQLWSPSNIDPKTLVTSGPFVLSRFVPSQRVEFVRTNNFYYMDPSGKRQLPYLDRLIFLFVPQVATNLMKFTGKDIDITQVRNKDAVDLLKEQDRLNFKLYNLGQDPSSYFMMFNMNQRKDSKGKPYVDPIKSAWFNDVNFRQAVNHALNRQQMVDGYLKGIGTPLYTCEPPSSVFFNKELKPFDQDLNYSQSLLAKSGFQKKPDGILYDKSGHKVEFDLLSNAGGTMNAAVAGYIMNDLKRLGIKVNYQEQEFNSLIDRLESTKQWDTCLFSLTADPTEPNNGANIWSSNGRLHVFDQRDPGPSGKIVATDARPWEKRIDEIFQQAVQEFDPAKRATLYHEYQQIMYDQCPMVFLITPMDLIGARNTIHNYFPTNLSYLTLGLHNIEEIYMDGGKAGTAPETSGGGGSDPTRQSEPINQTH